MVYAIKLQTHLGAIEGGGRKSKGKEVGMDWHLRGTAWNDIFAKLG